MLAFVLPFCHINILDCNWDLILHPLNFLPLSSVELNKAAVVEEPFRSTDLTCTELVTYKSSRHTVSPPWATI